MLKINSSARLKRRYLLVNGTRENIENALLEYLGLLGWSRAAPVMNQYDSKRWILAINRSEVHHVQAAFVLSASSITVERVSGTLQGLGIKKQKP